MLRELAAEPALDGGDGLVSEELVQPGQRLDGLAGSSRRRRDLLAVGDQDVADQDLSGTTRAGDLVAGGDVFDKVSFSFLNLIRAASCADMAGSVDDDP